MLKKLEKAIWINRILKLYVPLFKENVSRYCHSIISLIQKTKKKYAKAINTVSYLWRLFI